MRPEAPFSPRTVRRNDWCNRLFGGCDNFAWRIQDNLVKITIGPALDWRVDCAGRVGIVDQKSPKITSEQLVKLLLEKCPELGEKIIAALNDAPDGHWISGSEEQVRDAGHAFVKAAFEGGSAAEGSSSGSRFSLLHKTRGESRLEIKVCSEPRF